MMQQYHFVFGLCLILSLCILILITKPFGCSNMNSSRIFVKTAETPPKIQSSASVPPTERMIQVYREQAESRRDLLKSVWEQKQSGFLNFYNPIVPEVFCAELIRVGNVGDGGKWMCSPHELPTDCTVLSLGLHDEIQFEVHLQTLTEKRCTLIGYDSGNQNTETINQLSEVNARSFMGTISKTTGSQNGTISIEGIKKKHNIQNIEIIKIDIEGAEFEVLLPFLEKNSVSQVYSFFKPRIYLIQILIEIHSGGGYRCLELLVPLAKLGYWLASYEINGAWHDLSEFTLLHESAFNRYKATTLARYLNFTLTDQHVIVV